FFLFFFFFSSRRRHTRWPRDWSSDVCSSDLSFRFVDRPATMITPLRLDRNQTRLGNFSFQGIARLKRGATIDQATADAVRLIPKIGRASCRERGEGRGVDGTRKQKRRKKSG